MKTRCENCRSYNTHTWNGTDGHSEPQSVFECYGCGLTIENGEVTKEGKKEVKDERGGGENDCTRNYL